MWDNYLSPSGLVNLNLLRHLHLLKIFHYLWFLQDLRYWDHRFCHCRRIVVTPPKSRGTQCVLHPIAALAFLSFTLILNTWKRLTYLSKVDNFLPLLLHLNLQLLQLRVNVCKFFKYKVLSRPTKDPILFIIWLPPLRVCICSLKELQVLIAPESSLTLALGLPLKCLSLHLLLEF